MELKVQIFKAWKVTESGLGPGKSWKINQMFATFWRMNTITCLQPGSARTRWRSLSTSPCSLTRLRKFIWKSDLFDNHLIKQTWKVMEKDINDPGKSSTISRKVVENRFQHSACARIISLVVWLNYTSFKVLPVPIMYVCTSWNGPKLSTTLSDDIPNVFQKPLCSTCNVYTSCTSNYSSSRL